MNKKKLSSVTLEKYISVINEWFVNGFKGGLAYKKIYPNVSDRTAITNFSKIYAKEEIREYVKKKKEENAKKIDVTHEGILKELKGWLEADITQTIGLTPDEIKELPPLMRRAISKYKIKERTLRDVDGREFGKETYIEVVCIAKEKIIDMLNKHVGFYEVDNSQKVGQIDYSKLSIDALNSIMNAKL